MATFVGTTVESAKQFIQENASKGVDCPCCGRDCKIYKYKLHHSMVECLAGLVLQYQKTRAWYHVTRIAIRGGYATSKGGHLAKGVHWDLLVAKPNIDDPTKRMLGYWKPTQLGIDFVYGRIKLPEWVLLYQNKVIEIAQTKIDVKTALGQYINYEELMAPAW